MTKIEITDLSKKYILSHEEKERYLALRDVMVRKTKKVFSFFRTGVRTTREEFWALKDVNLEIQQGDRVGIIGRNGAGKSTLLKILSRITEPTTGQVKIRGSVASLLEVGTGFHPELTGRENIFLNGAILGMSRADIRRRFDEIVDFAEVEKFLDTPVKRYSSGMYVRLAFAVAAHLDPDILIVDEVLAVGDAKFQKKCLGKMDDVSKQEGRTVLFVSHNISAIKYLCNRGVLLSDGKVEEDGHISNVIERYNTYTSMDLNSGPEKIGPAGKWHISRVDIFQNGFKVNSIDTAEEVEWVIYFHVLNAARVSFELSLKDEDYNAILFIPLGLAQNFNFECSPGSYYVRIRTTLPHLSLGTYHLDIFMVESFVRRLATFFNITSFEVTSSYLPKTGWAFQKVQDVSSIIHFVKDVELTKV